MRTPPLSPEDHEPAPRQVPGAPDGGWAARLAGSHGRSVAGNLIQGDSPGLGFGRLAWWERELSTAALRGFVVLQGDLVAPVEDELVWQPDGIAAHYAVPDFVLDEAKTAHDDVLLDRVRVRNLSGRFRVLSLVFRCEFEGRKARARYAPGRSTAFVDLSLGQRTHVAIAAGIPPTRCIFRPLPELVDRDLLSATDPTGEAPAPGRRSLSFAHDRVVMGWRFDLRLDPGESVDLALAVACDPVADEAATRAEASVSRPSDALAAESLGWERYFTSEIPSFRCSDPSLEEVWLHAWRVQRANLVRIQNRRWPWPFQVASKPAVPHLRLWDSACHALITRWLRDPAPAAAGLRTAVLQQRADGMIPHETYLEPGTAWSQWPDGDGQSSSITQLPILAQAAWETYRVTGDRALLAELLPALVRYDRWLARERDRDGDALISFVHHSEGWGGSPRWDDGLDVEPVDANCVYYTHKQALGRMAAAMDDERLAVYYAGQAERVARAIREKMWDAAAATFFDLAGPDETPVRVRTPAAFLALTFGVAGREQAAALIHQLADPRRFWPAYPVPSVALDEPAFSPRRGWRGSAWTPLNALIVDGLRRYGRDDLAASLVRRTLGLPLQDGAAAMREYFDPLTGDALGAEDCGATGIVADLIVRHVCGVQPAGDDPEGETNTPTACWRYAPLDIGLDWYELALPGQGIAVRFDRESGYSARAVPAGGPPRD